MSLLEYDNIEGMIPLTELSNRRIRSFHKLIRVGRIEIAIVLRVDKEKGMVECLCSAVRMFACQNVCDGCLFTQDISTCPSVGWPLRN